MGAFQQMLLEFGVDLSPVKEAGEATKKLLEDLNVLSDKAEAGTAAATSKQAALSAQMAEAAKQAVADSEKAQKADDERFDNVKKHTEELKNSFGGGSLFEAVFGGELFAKGLEKIAEGLEHLVEKFKEVAIEGGKLTLLDDQFQRLAKGAGIDATHMMAHLDEATEGLVSRFQLLKLATAALSSPLHLGAEEVSKLTESVVRIAEYSGGTASQAINTLQRAIQTGNLRMLGSLPGMDRFSIAMTNISSTAQTTTRRLGESAYAMEQIIKRGEEIGETPKTLEQFFEMLSGKIDNVFLAFGKGLNQAEGIQNFLKTLGSMREILNSIADWAEKAGVKLGNAFGYVVPLLKQVWGILGDIWHLLADDILKAFEELAVAFGKLTGTESAASLLAKIFATWAYDIGVVVNGLRYIDDKFDSLTEKAHNLAQRAAGTQLKPFTGTFGPGGKVIDGPQMTADQSPEAKWRQREQAAADARDAAFKAIDAIRDADTHKEERPLSAKVAVPDSTFRSDEQKAKDALALQKAQDDRRLAEKERAIQEERRLDDEAYRSGEERLQQHIVQMQILNDKDTKAKLERAKTDYYAKLAEINEDERLKLSQNLVGPVGEKEITGHGQAERDIAEQVYGKQREQITAEGETKSRQITLQGNSQQYTAAMEHIQKLLVAEEKRVSEEAALNKERLANQQETLVEYVAVETKGYADVLSAQLESLRRQKEAATEYGQWNEKLQKELEDKRQAFAVAAAAKRVQLAEKIPGMQLQDLTGRFGQETNSLESRIGNQQQSPAGTFNTTTLELTQQLTEKLNTEMARLQYLASQTDSAANPKTWLLIYDQIQAIGQAQANWNEKLAEMAAIVSQVAPGFAAIGGSIGTNIRTKFGANLGANVSAGAKSLADSTKLGQQIAGGPAEDPKLKALQDQAAAIFSSLEPSAKDLTGTFTSATTVFATVTDQATQLGLALAKITGVLSGPGVTGGDQEDGGLPSGGAFGFKYSGGTSGKTAAGGGFNQSSTIPQFTNQLVGAISALDNFTTSILNSKSALAGMAGGGIGGAGLGNTLGTTFSSIGGPLGTAIGSAVGLVLGGILGAKQQQVTNNINSLNTSFTNMNQAFAMNTNNLNVQLQALQGLMAQAQAMQASSKKGHAQYQQVIDQYIQQINQLNVQQANTLRQMNQQVAILTEPQGAQSFLTTIQQIVQTYQQFEGAAQNADQLATANQFLTLSLQQYATTLEQQLDQDNQQAIQDAIQLNDLLYQRQQMMLQYNDQVQSILSQGVLTRQLTRAQSTGEQVQQLTVQYQMQLDATNEQVEATQYRVTAEQQIFNLATDRVGLENQLLAVQNAQAAYQMQAIVGLQGIVNQLSTGNLSGGSLGLLLSVMQTVSNPAAGVPTNASILQMISTLTSFLTGAAPSNSIAPVQSTSSLESSWAGAYQDRASMGFGNFRAQTI